MPIQQAPLREHYATEEQYQIELDAYLAEIERQINSGQLTGGTAIDVGTDDQERPTVGDAILGYQARYLHTRYATSAGGNTGFTNDYTTITDPTSVYQGLRNVDVVSESNNPADYTWRELSVVSGWRPQFRLIGGRQLDWDFSTTALDDFVLDTGTFTIDLEGFTAGRPGDPGVSVTADVSVRVLPSNLGTYTAAADGWDAGTVDPLDWNYDTDGMDFGDATEVKALVVEIRANGFITSLAERRTYNYMWSRNGLEFNPQDANVQLTRPFILINVDDLDGSQDQFLCRVTDS